MSSTNLKANPNYYAILPANIRYDNRLSANEKIMYAEITSLTQTTGECWASNKYFSDLYNVTPQAISKWINKIEKLGYISIRYNYKKGTKMIDKRFIKLDSAEATLVSTHIDTVSTQDSKGINTGLKGYQHRIKGNTTSINTTSTNTISTNSTNFDYKSVILYLNDKANKKFRNVESNNKFIRARCHEGYTLENFKQVIDTKTKEWLDTDMNKYLQPSTLFGNKFDQYLNQEKQGEDENEIERFGITI